MFYPEKSFSTIFATSVISSKHFMTKYFSLFLLILPALSIAQNSDEINWIDIEKAEQLRLKEPKKVIIDVYTDWCGWCKKMDITTFHNPKIVEYINKNYYAVKMDGECKNDIKLGGREFKFIYEGPRGYHELPSELMQGKRTYPTLVFLDENMNLIQPLPGYQSAKDLEPILAYWAENAYKSTSWEEFSITFGERK